MRLNILLVFCFGLNIQFAEAVELPFNVMVLKKETIPAVIYFDGTVEAINRSTISAQTPGEVIAINFDVNDFVNKGEVVIQLKGKQQAASLAQAKATLAESEARLKQAKQEHSRIKEIYVKKLVAKSSLDKASAELKAAIAREKVALAAIEKTQEQMGNTQIRAPYSGIVSKRHVELGEFVNTGQPLMTGISLEKLRVNVNVPQKIIADVRKQKQAFVETSEGVVIKTSSMTFFPFANPQSHDFMVRVQLDETVTDIFPGSFVKVGFITGEKHRLLISEEAVAWRSEVTGAYIIDTNNIPHFHQLRLGRQVKIDAKQFYEVLAGVNEGEAVAMNPAAAAALYKQTQGIQNTETAK